ncbi:MAG: DNA helicase, partial [Verrucomicrobiae bacterium]|nr:DNA helicase [Verrucomicrobiae bacterium]
NQRMAVARSFQKEFLVTHADPCQSAAVEMAQTAPVLVMHGPPGTGKSQTIVNIIGDHLARGERLLFVCDKRTALDVVKYRLDAIGLGGLCGVIHDPQRDRRDFYMGLRSVLEELPDSKRNKSTKRKLGETNRRLDALHGELREVFSLLHVEDDAGETYHGLVGRWLVSRTQAGVLLETAQGGDDDWCFEMADVEAHRVDVSEVLKRARDARYSNNPWPHRAGLSLEQWLGLAPDQLEAKLATAEDAGAAVDAEPFDRHLPLPESGELPPHAEALREVGAILRSIDPGLAPLVEKVITQQAAAATRFAGDWANVSEICNQVCHAPLDRELALQVRGAWPSMGILNERLHALAEWKEAEAKWTGVFAFSKKKAAREAVIPLGIQGIRLPEIERAAALYSGLKSRLLVADIISGFEGAPGADSDTLPEALQHIDHGLRLRTLLEHRLQGLAPLVMAALGGEAAGVADAVDVAARRADAIAAWENVASASGMWKSSAIAELSKQLRTGAAAATILPPFREYLPKLEPVLRLEHNVAQLPQSMSLAMEWLAGAADRCEDEEAIAALNATAIRCHLGKVLRENPALAHIDTARVDAAFDELNKRLSEKQELTRLAIVDHWTELQRDRLLAGTGNRVNSTGSGLRQRLLVRGKRALTLRQLVAAGAEIEGGDPLFDLCPVWMASADTVAQIFPRETVFDSVVFDEASQCRLEEALPVLLRARRVVIAGDPRQLPPTRFFESALVDSEDTDAETPEELHQQQMSETEDLLAAALNLDVHEAFLDVHYRSQNEALIGFSNDHFYQSRLQPIPGHPRNKALTAPIRLVRVDGVYKDQSNHDEAVAIGELVAELLGEAQPPSIGIASFNLKQRTLILEQLEQRAENDREFADRLATARQRRGRDSFEGLFVKNLENVQGDERDHIIISTTFGKDEEGKFRRNFGALSRLGGERRLNVLVTRARSAIHVFTSIPRGEYSGAELPGPGERVTGRHLLYAYLRYAEHLEDVFESYQDHLETLRSGGPANCAVHQSSSPSAVATALGRNLAHSHKAANAVHWGNDGFCIDIAMIHPQLPEDVTIGVLTDFNRYRKTPDPIDWKRFRNLIFRAQGWDLHRLWSPRLLRDPDGEIQQLIERHLRVAGAEQ